MVSLTLCCGQIVLGLWAKTLRVSVIVSITVLNTISECSCVAALLFVPATSLRTEGFKPIVVRHQRISQQRLSALPPLFLCCTDNIRVPSNTRSLSLNCLTPFALQFACWTESCFLLLK